MTGPPRCKRHSRCKFPLACQTQSSSKRHDVHSADGREPQADGAADSSALLKLGRSSGCVTYSSATPAVQCHRMTEQHPPVHTDQLSVHVHGRAACGQAKHALAACRGAEQPGWAMPNAQPEGHVCAHRQQRACRLHAAKDDAPGTRSQAWPMKPRAAADNGPRQCSAACLLAHAAG